LFQEARAQLQAGKAAEACPLLEASQRVDAAVGTQLLLAHCYEQMGKTASAWALFREVESLAGDRPDRRELARVRANDLEKRLSKLIVSLDPSVLATFEPDQLHVTRDNAALPRPSWELAVPVDPGAHQVRVTGDGIEAWQQSLEVPAGPSVTTLVIRDLRRAAPVVQPPAGRSPRAQNVAVEEGGTRRQPPAGESQWPWGPIVTGGVGALGLIAAAGFAWSAQDTYEASQSHCRSARLCDVTGLQLRSEAYERADWASTSSVVGASLLGAAGLWYWIDAGERAQSGPRASVQPSIGQRSLGVVLQGVL
jgi:serine/threonine-protein kinase